MNVEKSELEPKQVFDFVGYQFDLRSRPGPTDTGPVAEPSRENKDTLITTGLSGPAAHVPDRPTNSHRKAVHLGRLHMRPIQWHLKNNWRVPESLEKVIPLPTSLHPHLQWWLVEDNVLQGQALHPLQHALQIFTDASKEGWGAHLNERTVRGLWSVPESNLAHKLSGTESSLPSLKRIPRPLYRKDSSRGNRQHHSGGIYKQGRRHEVRPLCALLWRILTWCSQRQVTLKARHIPGHLNVIADKLSRLGQTIQTEWSLLPEIFQRIWQQMAPASNRSLCNEIQHKLPQFVSPVPDPRAIAVDALTLPWEDLDAYAFPLQPSWAKWWRNCWSPLVRNSF